MGYRSSPGESRLASRIASRLHWLGVLFLFWARAAHDRVVAEFYDPERFEVWTTQNYQQHQLVSSNRWPAVLKAFQSAGDTGCRGEAGQQANMGSE